MLLKDFDNQYIFILDTYFDIVIISKFLFFLMAIPPLKYI